MRHRSGENPLGRFCSENHYEDDDGLYKTVATIEPSTISYYGLFGRADGIWPGDYYVFHGAGPIQPTGMNFARAAGVVFS